MGGRGSGSAARAAAAACVAAAASVAAPVSRGGRVAAGTLQQLAEGRSDWSLLERT